MTTSIEIKVFQRDLDKDFERAVMSCAAIAWDIETTGLDWNLDKMGTCQLHHPDIGTAIVQLGDEIPSRLLHLLSCQKLLKVFHHAPFDLRFMAHKWKTQPVNVACTKIAAKILTPGLDGSEYSLRPLLQRRLGVSINKTQQRSDWMAENLSDEQIKYATSDVIYLLPLLENLKRSALASGVWSFVEASFTYLPVRVALDLLGAKDVFTY